MTSIETISEITLNDRRVLRRAEHIEHERAVALADLLRANRFAPLGLNQGPYRVTLSTSENRLRFDIASETMPKPVSLRLSVAPLRGIIKDYFLVCESYFSAIKEGNNYRVEAVDMGRRGLHNEGAELLKTLLDGKIDVDFETARRLFTLICVLHIK